MTGGWSNFNCLCLIPPKVDRFIYMHMLEELKQINCLCLLPLDKTIVPKVCGSYMVGAYNISHMLQLPLIRLHNETWVALANLWWIINKNPTQNPTSFSLVIMIACLLISWLNAQVLSLVFHVECEIVNKPWSHHPLNVRLSIYYLLFDPYQITHRLNIEVWFIF